jgi:hypothetical protein
LLRRPRPAMAGHRVGFILPRLMSTMKSPQVASPHSPQSEPGIRSRYRERLDAMFGLRPAGKDRSSPGARKGFLARAGPRRNAPHDNRERFHKLEP